MTHVRYISLLFSHILDTEIPSKAQDDQPPLEPFEEVLAGELDKAMLYDE